MSIYMSTIIETISAVLLFDVIKAFEYRQYYWFIQILTYNLKIFPLGNLGAWLVCCMVTAQCKLKGMSAIFMAKLSKNTMNIVGKNVVV